MSNDNAIDPAFPTFPVTNANGDVNWGANGLTKLEYFAAKALQGYCANPELLHWSHEESAEHAKFAANALIVELMKNT